MDGFKGDFLNIFMFFAPSDLQIVQLLTIHQWKAWNWLSDVLYIKVDPYDWFCGQGSHLNVMFRLTVFCCILWITDSFNVRFCVSVLCQSLFISAVLCHFQISVCMCLTGASSNLFKSPLWRSVHSDGGDWQVSSCSPCWLLCCSSSVSITSPLPPSSTSTHLTQNLNPTGVAFRLETDDGSDPGNF